MNKVKIGILKEGKVPIDKRVPIIPAQAKEIEERFENAQAVADWEIPTTDYNRFNRLRKTNPGAFFYIFKAYEIFRAEKG